MPLSEQRTQELETFQTQTSLRFKRLELLNLAFTHTSYGSEGDAGSVFSNQRLEFLGDAILGEVVSEYLYRTRPDLDEGNLTKIKAVVVSEPVLFELAKELSLGDYLLLGRGEVANGGRERCSILADAFEAVVGALYLDRGKRVVSAFILELLRDRITRIERQEHFFDYKSTLQELTQSKYQAAPVYRLVEARGPDHQKVFHVEVYLQELLGRGKGVSKKSAQQNAAREALEVLKQGKLSQTDEQPAERPEEEPDSLSSL